MELGKQIYELRKKANLSQEQLAEKVGVYPTCRERREENRLWCDQKNMIIKTKNTRR